MVKGRRCVNRDGGDRGVAARFRLRDVATAASSVDISATIASRPRLTSSSGSKNPSHRTSRPNRGRTTTSAYRASCAARWRRSRASDVFPISRAPGSCTSDGSDTGRSQSRSTAITTSAPMSRTGSAGTGIESPPSARSLPSIVTGRNTHGTEMLARTTEARSPSRKITTSPDRRSVAMTASGIRQSSTRRPPTNFLISRSSFVPPKKPCRSDGSNRGTILSNVVSDAIRCRASPSLPEL